MTTYHDLVNYVKDNHINWNTELFSLLRDFFEGYTRMNTTDIPDEQGVLFPQTSFEHPSDGEYSTQKLLDLFSQP